MKNIQNKLLAIILLAYLLPNSVSGQSLKDRISDCYQFLINNQDLTLNMDIKVWKRGRKDRTLDEDQFIYTTDKEGFYMKTADIEVIQNEDITLRLDHALHEVSIIPSPKNKGRSPNDLGLPTWLKDVKNLDLKYTIEKENKNGEEVFTLKQGEAIAMIINLQDKRITKLVQYPPQQVTYKGKSITTVMEMNYKYQSAQKRLRLNDVINKNLLNIKLKSKYAKYKIIDYRDLENQNNK